LKAELAVRFGWRSGLVMLELPRAATRMPLPSLVSSFQAGREERREIALSKGDVSANLEQCVNGYAADKSASFVYWDAKQISASRFKSDAIDTLRQQLGSAQKKCAAIHATFGGVRRPRRAFSDCIRSTLFIGHFEALLAPEASMALEDVCSAAVETNTNVLSVLDAQRFPGPKRRLTEDGGRIRVADLWDGRVRRIMNDASIAPESVVTYTDSVKSLVPKQLLAEFHRRLGNSELKHADRAFTDAVASMMYDAVVANRASSPTTLADQFLLDPDTGLKLPPDPRVSFRLRVSSFGSKMNASTFLRTVWKDYTKAHLLYAEHIRSMDPALYAAMNYEARINNTTLPDFMLANGVLGKDHVLHPPAGYERQANLLGRVRMLSRARSLESYVATLKEKDFGPVGE
jgi:hypothetical protein